MARFGLSQNQLKLCSASVAKSDNGCSFSGGSWGGGGGGVARLHIHTAEFSSLLGVTLFVRNKAKWQANTEEVGAECRK